MAPQSWGHCHGWGGVGVLGFLGRTHLTGEKVTGLPGWSDKGSGTTAVETEQNRAPRKQELSGFSIPGYSHRS